ncbi:MAG TPA: helix-turn-helix domain-containing protein [Leptolyngbyaceae cyanobacterium M65_K2018_010]|nr:helix-turn-helix domain-containing protein [Leptolyngbyaceae cyanobacterium M65_K2018_010]
MKTKDLVDSNTLYQQQLSELGALLRAAREQQGHTLAAMASQTLIRTSLLAAIEAGDLDSLPEPVYIRGLIRRYGDALHLDGDTLASQFFTPLRVQRHSWKESPAAQLRPLHLYVTYFLVLLAAVSGLSYLLKRTIPEVTVLPPLDPLNSVETAAAPADNEARAPLTEAEPAEPQAPIEVKMTLTAQSWLRVTADGSTQFEGILQPGDTRLWTADQALTIRAGNAGGVMVSFNNRQTEALGQPGMVKEVTYSADKMIGLAY